MQQEQVYVLYFFSLDYPTGTNEAEQLPEMSAKVNSMHNSWFTQRKKH